MKLNNPFIKEKRARQYLRESIPLDVLGEGRVGASHSGQWMKTSGQRMKTSQEEEEGRKALVDMVLPLLPAPWCASCLSPG